MNDKRPQIETNDRELERPWVWLARIPCVYFNGLGNPYAGTAELRVSLLNHEGTEDDPVVQPIHLSGLFPFGALADSYKAESMGCYSLTADEARALAAGLLRAAVYVEGDERVEPWGVSPVLHAVVASDGFPEWPYLYSIHADERDAAAEIERREADPDGSHDLCTIAVQIDEGGMVCWNEDHPWPSAVRGERTCPNCEWAESDCVCKIVMAKYLRAERMLERLLAGFEVAIVESERSYEVFTDMHDGLVHFLAHENVEGLGEDYELTPDIYERLAAWALRRAATVAAVETGGAPRRAMGDRILEGLRGQNEQAMLPVGEYRNDEWKSVDVRVGFWCQSDAVLVDARTPAEATTRYRSMVAKGEVGISHNHHTAEIRALRAERGSPLCGGTSLPEGPVMATWRDQHGVRVTALFYCGGGKYRSDERYYDRGELEDEIAAGKLRVRPLPPAFAEPLELP